MTKSICVRFQFEGQHCWPEAPDAVAFLRTPHRHIFHVEAKITVSHGDREVEFILFKRELENYVSVWGFDLGRASCEEMAQDLVNYIASEYRFRNVEVGVFEDGENGAIVSLP